MTTFLKPCSSPSLPSEGGHWIRIQVLGVKGLAGRLPEPDPRPIQPHAGILQPHGRIIPPRARTIPSHRGKTLPQPAVHLTERWKRSTMRSDQFHRVAEAPSGAVKLSHRTGKPSRDTEKASCRTGKPFHCGVPGVWRGVLPRQRRAGELPRAPGRTVAAARRCSPSTPPRTTPTPPRSRRRQRNGSTAPSTTSATARSASGATPWRSWWGEGLTARRRSECCAAAFSGETAWRG